MGVQLVHIEITTLCLIKMNVTLPICELYYMYLSFKTL